MATYKKSLKTVTFTLHDASTVVAADTAEKAIGSMAFAAFQSKDIVFVPGETDTYIPYEAIIKAVVATSQSEELSRDAYGCDEKGETVEP